MCVATQPAKIQVGKVKSYSLQGVVSESHCEWAKHLTVRNVAYQDFISTPHRGDVRCHRRSREWRICRNPKKLRRYKRQEYRAHEDWYNFWTQLRRDFYACHDIATHAGKDYRAD